MKNLTKLIYAHGIYVCPKTYAVIYPFGLQRYEPSELVRRGVDLKLVSGFIARDPMTGMSHILAKDPVSGVEND